VAKLYDQGRRAATPAEAAAIFAKAEDTADEFKKATALEDMLRDTFAAFQRSVFELGQAQRQGERAVMETGLALAAVRQAADATREAAAASAKDHALPRAIGLRFDGAVESLRGAREEFELAVTYGKSSEVHLALASKIQLSDVLAALERSPLLISKLGDLRIADNIQAVAKSSARAKSALASVAKSEQTVRDELAALEVKVAEAKALYRIQAEDYAEAQRLFDVARGKGRAQEAEALRTNEELLKPRLEVAGKLLPVRVGKAPDYRNADTKAVSADATLSAASARALAPVPTAKPTPPPRRNPFDPASRAAPEPRGPPSVTQPSPAATRLMEKLRQDSAASAGL